MYRYRVLALSLVLLVLQACATTFPSGAAGTGAGRAPNGSSGATATAAAATAIASGTANGMGTPEPTATATGANSATPRPTTPPSRRGTTQKVWQTFYAATDNDPAGSRNIAYPAPQGKHARAGGTGTYADPITLAADERWLPVGTIVYAPRWHKYFIMEDQCVPCEADWEADRLHHVDLFMSPSSRSAVVACERAATKPQAENDSIILNPDRNRPVDATPLYTDAGGCVAADHEY
jgi:hypothetical protein